MIYKTIGVCSRSIDVELDENNIITKVEFDGGCSGNTKGLAKMVVGEKAEDVIARLKGIDCNGRGTSCPDQLALALQQALLSKGL